MLEHSHCGQSLKPSEALPLDCYLVASQDPLRTWTSSLAQRVAEAGGEDLVRAARKGYQLEVQRLLADPKQADEDGDYFEARTLRASLKRLERHAEGVYPIDIGSLI